MKRLFIIVVLLIGRMSAQNIGARFDSIAQVSTGGSVRVIPFPTVVVCNHGSTVSNCGQNSATTYTDASLSTPCPPSAPVVLNQTNTCVSQGDANGNFGFWVSPQVTLDYMVSGSGATAQIYAFTTGGSATGSVVVTPPTASVNPTALDFNNVQTGTSSNNQNVTVTNTSVSTPISVNGITFFPTTPFSSPTPNVCNGVLAAQAQCSIPILCNPSSLGLQTAVATIATTASPLTVALSCTGQAAPSFNLTVVTQGSGAGVVTSDETPPAISCPPNCAASYTTGATPVLTAQANTGSTFVNFSGADATTSPSTVTMIANETVTATFNLAPPTFTLTIAGGGQGTGTVTSDLIGINSGQPLNCTSTAGVTTGKCSITLPQNAQPVLTETPAASNTFTSWGGISTCTTASTCQPTISANMVVSAIFAAPVASSPVTLVQTINSGTGGASTIAGSNLTNGTSVAGTTSYATASVTPSSNNLVLIGVTATLNSGNGPGAVSTVTGNSLTWAKVTSFDCGFTEGSGKVCRAEIWRALGASPTAGAITVTYGTTPVRVSWTVDQFSGVSTSGSNGSGAIGNIAESDNDGVAYNSPLSVTMPTFGSPANGTYGYASLGRSSTLSPNAGMTTLTSRKDGSGATALSIIDEWAATNKSPVTATYPDAGDYAVIFGVELVAASSNNMTGTFGSAQSAGDLNIIGIVWNDNTTTVSGVTDTNGNSYTESACAPKAIAGDSVDVYYSPNIAAAGAGANTVSVAMSASPSFRKIFALEYSGMVASPLDTCHGATGTGTAISSGNLTTGTAGDFLVSFAKADNAISAKDPLWTQEIANTGSDAEDRQVTTTTTYANAPTQASSGNWADIATAWLTATTAPPTFSFSIIGGSGSGTVTAAGLSCTITNGVPGSSGCSEQVASGAGVTLLATPASGFTFANYSGAGCTVNPTCLTVSITTNTNVSVNFSSGCAGPYSITSQPPVTCPFYGQGTNNVTNKRLPADVMSHLATGGDTRAQTAVAGGGKQYQSPGSDDQGVALWYSQATDPFYVSNGCPNGTLNTTFPNLGAFRARNNANATDQGRPDQTYSGDGFIRIWDQQSGVVWGGYVSVPGAPYTIGSSTATTAATAVTMNRPSACGAAKNIFTDQDWGKPNGWQNNEGTEGSMGLAPMAGIVRNQEWIQGQINHALVLGVACTNAYNGSYHVFPSNSETSHCSVATTMPPNGALLFFDYTDAQIAAMGLPAWQKTLVTAMSHYGGYVDITGDSGGTGGLTFATESPMAYQLQTGGFLPAPTGNGMKVSGGTPDPILNFLQVTSGFACGGSSGTSACKYNINWLTGIPNVGGTGVASHIHMADPCIAEGYANQTGGCN